MNLVIKWLITLVLVFSISIISAQVSTPSYLNIPGNTTLEGTGNVVNNATINIPQTDKTVISGLQENSTSADLYLKLDLGEDYIEVGGTFKVQFTVDVLHGATPLASDVISIDEATPEALHKINLLSNVASFSNTYDLDVKISNLTITDNATNPLPSGILKNYVDNNLRFSANFVREYGVDVRLPSGIVSSGLINPTATLSNRVVTFSWAPISGIDGYPNYELQILKLYNTDPAKKNLNNELTTEIDWSKALRVETQSYETSINLTVAEGTGFYVWRVRPIGNYYEGGIANHENYGKWSSSFPNGSTQNVQLNAIGGANASSYGSVFYFKDIDEDINWIYNRVFTEGNTNSNNSQGVKTSEGISYADGLLRARQTQAYNNSNNTTLVTQTISDYSGRPALTTLPVPVEDGLVGYKTTFVKSSTNTLYTAIDFDDGTNIDHPKQIISSTTNNPFKYYDGNGGVTIGNETNKNVADAEGYPYKRTIFKTDGTGRVDEESGVGRIHAIGTQGGSSSQGGGRTTRILFGSPSDEELIRIFGEEAPLAESVIKTITIDPNNVVSATYTSKEGKTIATALITDKIMDGSKTVLESLEEPIDPLLVKNIADQNVLSNQKFVSSKRIAVEELKTITLGYTLNNGVSMGGCPIGNCNLKVRFFLTDIQTGKTYISDANDLTLNDFEPFDLPGSTLVFPSGSPEKWRWVDQSQPTIPVPTAFSIQANGGNYDQFNLPEGEYIITKEVYSVNDENFAALEIADLTERLQPILDVLAAKMKAIETNADYEAYIDFYAGDPSIPLLGFVDHVNAYHTTPNQTTSDAIYTHLGLTPPASPALFPEEFSFDNVTPISGDANDPTQNVMAFSLSCCGGIEVPVPKPEICEPCEATQTDGFAYNGIDKLRADNPTGTYFIDNSGGHNAGWTEVSSIVENHFMSFLLDKLYDDDFITTASKNDPDLQEVLDRFAPGFTFQSLQDMITNMLVSRYWEGQSKENSGTYYRAEEDANGALVFLDDAGAVTTTPSEYVEVTGINDGDEFNYNCKELYKCWVNAVNLINAFDFDGDANVMNSFNDSEGNNASEDHYDDEDSGDSPSGVVGWVANLVISVEMRNFQDGPDGEVPQSRLESLVNLPNIFVKCAGYKFAKILDEDETLPNEYSTSSYGWSNSDYEITYNSVKTPGLFSYDPNGNPKFDEKFTQCPGPFNNQVLQYEYIIKPEWMFKYFVYNAFDPFTASSTTNDQTDVIVINQYNIEMASCYNDPQNACAPNQALPLCFGETCNYYHHSWSSRQRLNFFQQIRGGLNCPPDPNTPTPLTPVALTKEELIEQANEKLDDAIAICENRAGDIKTALITELENKCYTLVECVAVGSPSYDISEVQVDEMVAEVVEACSTQVEQIRVDLPTFSGSCSGGNSSLGYGCTLDPQYIAGTSSNQYPSVEHVACNWIDISGTCHQNIKQTIVLFAPCHQEILDQLTGWKFNPNIPVADLDQDQDQDNDDINACCISHNMQGDPNCPANTKEWVNYCSNNSCPGAQSCTHSTSGKIYSSQTDIPAGGN